MRPVARDWDACCPNDVIEGGVFAGSVIGFAQATARMPPKLAMPSARSGALFACNKLFRSHTSFQGFFRQIRGTSGFRKRTKTHQNNEFVRASRENSPFQGMPGQGLNTATAGGRSGTQSGLSQVCIYLMLWFQTLVDTQGSTT